MAGSQVLGLARLQAVAGATTTVITAAHRVPPQRGVPLPLLRLLRLRALLAAAELIAAVADCLGQRL